MQSSGVHLGYFLNEAFKTVGPENFLTNALISKFNLFQEFVTYSL